MSLLRGLLFGCNGKHKLHLQHFECSFTEFEAKLKTCFFPSDEALQITLGTHQIMAHWETMQRVVAAKLTRQTQKIVTVWHLVAEIVLLAIFGLSSKFRNF